MNETPAHETPLNEALLNETLLNETLLNEALLNETLLNETLPNEGLPPCPTCSSPYTYEMGALLVCPECAHEWAADASTAPAANGSTDEAAEGTIRDSVGNVLSDGDDVTVVKALKVKGHPTGIKAGTKVRNIRLTPGGVDGHDIDCKIDGFGVMQLKSSVVRKA